ncbi:hypothetical protein [Serratia marcescens]|uniref:hypothetical protein n=1 Tax=Serratia marcescens TaxID=615 RepID=UPI0011E777DD|nr:hypothetical protein [Serratia marcescens]
MHLLKSTVFLILMLIYSTSGSANTELTGNWKETSSADTPSIVKLEPTPNGWSGKYIFVGESQTHYGYKVGDEVIRGKFEGGKFKGQVAIRIPEPWASQCPSYRVRWKNIEMVLLNNNTLRGDWAFSSINMNCEESDQQRVEYELSRE